MSYNATRLTCFALISALEEDARTQIAGIDGVEWPKVTIDNAHMRYERERGVWNNLESVLIEYIDFADAYQILLSNKALLPAPLADSLASVKSRLDALTAIRNRVAHSRPMEINDFPLLHDVASLLTTSAPEIWSTVNDTLRHLASDPSFVLALRIDLKSDPVRQPMHNLPAPDFDETGFFGRKTELRRIKKALRGAWPVVSILGDGGIGKTALALKVAYDELDDSSCDYEAVVWVSAKSTALTVSGVEAINDAIQDSLGLFQTAAESLGSPAMSTEDVVEEVLRYLQAFKVLLVLDNLETVADRRLRSFFEELPAGSKLLITSRIGLGIDNPIKLEPLDRENSRQLFRALSSIRSVKALLDLDEPAIDKLLARLHGHPLYIKWLVSGVQAGKRPGDLLQNKQLILDFCMSNVFDKLSVEAVAVLQALMVVQEVVSQAQLAFLCEMPAQKMQEVLLELLTTNFVVMRSSGKGEIESLYQLGDFAAQYLSSNHPANAQTRARVTRRRTELERLERSLGAVRPGNRYDPFWIDSSSVHHIPAAKLLIEAVKLMRTSELDEALRLCREAQQLSPNYYEAWRVEAMIHARRQDHLAAVGSFDTALDLAEGSPTSLFHYGTYLVNSSQFSRGIPMLQRAAQLDDASLDIKMAIATGHFQAADYEASFDSWVAVARWAELDRDIEWACVQAGRAAVFGCETSFWNGEIDRTLDQIDDYLALVASYRDVLVGEEVGDWAVRLRDVAGRAVRDQPKDEYVARHAKQVADRIAAEIEASWPTFVDRATGQIVNIDTDRHFAFVRATTGGQDYFFHHNDLVDRTQWAALEMDMLASFDGGFLPGRGYRASSVRLLA